MPKQTHKYCRLTNRNIGFFWKDGKRVYLPGLYNSPESLAAYHNAMAEINEAKANEVSDKKKSNISVPIQTNAKLTVAELVAMFLEWGKSHYVKNGKPTGANDQYYHASIELVKEYGHYVVTSFTQRELIALRNSMNVGGLLSRKTINDRLTRIKRIFNWGVSEGHYGCEIAKNLEYVETIRKGCTVLPERPKRKPVADSIVEATLPHLPPLVADMVAIQRFSGMRPSEVFSMTWEQIDTSDDIWIYTPSHKTEHHDIDRFVPLNEKCQDIMAKYRNTAPDQIIFSPKRTMRERAAFLAEKRSKGKNKKIQPSQIKRKMYKQVRGENLVNDTYTRHSYKNAIQRACKRAGVDNWTPYQLRHSSATEVANKLSKEDAKIILGHTDLRTTENYVHEEAEKVKAVARKLGQK